MSRIVAISSLFVAFAGVGLAYVPRPADPAPAADYLFCFWNVENLFDDKDDKRNEVDETYDNPFAEDAVMRNLKLDHLADALLKMNGGKGPDVIACVEIESVRALDLLRGTLNRKLDEAKADPKLKYTQVAMKNLDAGRHIAPGIITRLNVAHAQTKLHGRDLRILETHLFVNGHDLTILATHWTSKVSAGGGDGGRNKYAETIYDTYLAVAKKNPKTDFLVCGDFNDEPQSEPVRNVLGALADKSKINDPPAFLNLMANKDPLKFGTHTFNGKPLIYDQICVSPGLLDGEGWSVDPESIRTMTDGLMRPGATRREPWRFGDPKNPPTGGRGFSDHFPVTVTLKVQAATK